MIDINNLKKMIENKEVLNYNIMLIGFMGAGKTTVSKKLADKLGLNCIEIDDKIEKDQGIAISEIFSKYGEDKFRDLESQAIEDLKYNKGNIVSCGGGVVLREKNVKSMRENGKTVLLTASPETTLSRVKDSNDRPILNGNMNVDFIENLMENRREKYLESADIIVDTNNKTVDEVCMDIIEKIVELEVK